MSHADNGHALPKVTISTLAQALDVSPATVSLVLRQKPGVGDETRRRVLEAAERLGYRRPARTRATAPSKLKTVGVLVKARPDDPPHANEFYSHVLVGIEAACREARLNLLWGTLLVDAQNRPVDVPALVEEGGADALLVVGMRLDAPLLSQLQRVAPALVLVDSYLMNAAGEPANHNLDSVLAANRAGGEAAAATLYKQGHRHIAVLGGEANAYPSLCERVLGVQDYLGARRDARLYMAPATETLEGAGHQIRTLLESHPQISACFGVNDQHAIVALRAAEAMGRRIPHDLAVIGFDGIDRGEFMSPSLTTVRVDKLKMGRMAVCLLLDRVAHPAGASVTAVVEGQLITRESTPPPSGRNAA